MKHASWIVGGVVLGFAAGAIAEPVYVNAVHSGDHQGRGIAVSLSGGLSFWDGSTSKTVWAGQCSMDIDGRDVTAYSAEITSLAASGWHDQVETSAALGAMKAASLDSLFAATGGQFGSVDESVAFQALVWEIVYDFDGSMDSLDLREGRVAFGAVNQQVFDQMKLAIMSRGGSDPSVLLVGSEVSADFLVLNDPRVIIPLPSTCGLAGAGLLGLVARRRRA